jgi:hypothetical protein
LSPEAHTKRQATQHGCLPGLLGDGDKRTKIAYGEEKNYFVLGRLESKAEQKSCEPARQAQKTNQGRTPFICTLWIPVHLSFNSEQEPPLSCLSACFNIYILSLESLWFGKDNMKSERKIKWQKMACEKRPEIILKKELYCCNMANIYF